MLKNFIFGLGDNSDNESNESGGSRNSSATSIGTMDAEKFQQILQLQQSMLDKLVNLQGTAGVPTLPAITVLLPNFENFDRKKESFRIYKQRFENYIDMKNLKENKEYTAKSLLNSIGSQNYKTITALPAPEALTELTYDELIDLLEKHMSP